MTDVNTTIRTLAAITDAALFERLATAVLRSSDPARYGNINHGGVNTDGKTVKSPFDNFGWISATDGVHMVAVAHTTCDLNDLEGKWLHDPSTVKPRNPTGKPTAPEGDLRKAIREITSLREAQPSLKATFALTCNREPGHELMTAARKLANASNITIDIWSASRLAHYLDNKPQGQWLRRTHLGEPVQLVSPALLLSCAKRTIENRAALSGKDEIIERDISMLSPLSHTLIVGPSGVGKTTVALQLMNAHLATSGLGLVIAHETLTLTSTLAEAIDSELRKLEPDLQQNAGAHALSLASENSPFLVLVEDANRASDPSNLLNKIISWALAKSSEGEATHWRLICPVWPRYLDSLDQSTNVAKKILIHHLGTYSDAEAAEAIGRRSVLTSSTLLPAQITSIAKSLGNDPLLIGLSDLSNPPNSANVVDDYINREFSRTASLSPNMMHSDLSAAAAELARQMMRHRNLTPTWADISNWFLREPTNLDALRLIVKTGTVLRLQTRQGTDALVSRHDRVLLALLVRVTADAFRQHYFDEPYISDPFFAEVVGVAALEISSNPVALDELVTRNPLAMFHTFQAAVIAAIYCQNIVDTLSKWLQQEGTQRNRLRSVRFSGLQVLAHVDSHEVLHLTELFWKDERYDAWCQARFRNGDLNAGLQLLTMHPFGITIAGRKELLKHIFARLGSSITLDLSALLMKHDIEKRTYRGGLYLAGYLGDPAFSPAILGHWKKADPDERDLEAYLWAASRCHDKSDCGLLASVCDAWAELPGSNNPGELSPRSELAEYEIAWEFRDYTPVAAIPYFVHRAETDDRLSWQITQMLRGIDHPVAIEHVVRYFAKLNIASHIISDEWQRRQQELGRRMSDETKKHLLQLAYSTDVEDEVRKTAFRAWGVTKCPEDVKHLKIIGPEHLLYEEAIWQRARRADLSVIPNLIALISKDPLFWWKSGRYIWSSEMFALLDVTIQELANNRAKGDLRDRDIEWILSELLMELDTEHTEPILMKNWDDLKKSPRFFQAALYHGSPALMPLIASTIDEAENPSDLFEHLKWHMGWKTTGRKGISFELTERLARLSNYLSDTDIYALWMMCNERGWVSLRKQYFDSILLKSERYSKVVGASIDFSGLEKALDDPDSFFPHFWIENNLRQGSSLSELIDALLDWLTAHTKVRALEIVADIFRISASRLDLKRLTDMTRSWSGSEDILVDLEFSVRKRTLQ